MKITLYISHKSKENILKVIKPKMFHQNSFINISFRKVVRSIFNK